MAWVAASSRTKLWKNGVLGERYRRRGLHSQGFRDRCLSERAADVVSRQTENVPRPPCRNAGKTAGRPSPARSNPRPVRDAVRLSRECRAAGLPAAESAAGPAVKLSYCRRSRHRAKVRLRVMRMVVFPCRSQVDDGVRRLVSLTDDSPRATAGPQPAGLVQNESGFEECVSSYS